MTGYHVVWEIDVDADSHQEAAAEAHRLVRKPDTTATVYDVIKHDEADFVRIDLTEATATPSPESHVARDAGMISPQLGRAPAEALRPPVDDRLLYSLKAASDDAEETHHDAEEEAGWRKPSPISHKAEGMLEDYPGHSQQDGEVSDQTDPVSEHRSPARVFPHGLDMRLRQYGCKSLEAPLQAPPPSTTGVGSKSIIVCHIRTSAGARFSIHEDEESLRVELIDYYNECLAEGDFELADDTELQEAQDAIEESEDVSWEEVLL
jgi:hypothetical protein